MREMLHRARGRRQRYAAAAALLLAAGCSPHSSAPVAAPKAAEESGLIKPAAEVGTIALTSLQFPPVGQEIGGHFEGQQFEAKVSSLQLSEGARLRLSRRGLDYGAAVLRGAGFSVRDAPGPTSDATQLSGVRFGLGGEVELTVRTTGAVAPQRVTATASINWELLDLAAGAAIYAGQTSGRARLDDSLELAITQAVAAAFQDLLGDLEFRRALSRPRPLNPEDLLLGSQFEQPIPPSSDTIWIDRDDVPSFDGIDPVQRVAGGVVAVYTRNGTPVTGFALTKTGLVLSLAMNWRSGPYWGRFHDGVERPLRVLRVREGVSLLEVRCDDPCPTVPWSDTTMLRHASPIFVVGAPLQRREPFWVGHGRVGRGADRGSYDVIVNDLEGGEPVARREDGLVVAVVGANRHGVTIEAALRTLGVAVRGP